MRYCRSPFFSLMMAILISTLAASGLAYAYLRWLLRTPVPGAAVTAALFALALSLEGLAPIPTFLLAFAAAAWMWSDAMTGYIRDSLTIPTIGALLIVDSLTRPSDLAGLALPLAVIPLFFWPKRGALGGGDFKAIAVLGLGLGLSAVFGLLASCVLALIVVGGYALTKRLQPGVSVRFGPYLAVGMLAAVPTANALAPIFK